MVVLLDRAFGLEALRAFTVAAQCRNLTGLSPFSVTRRRATSSGDGMLPQSCEVTGRARSHVFSPEVWDLFEPKDRSWRTFGTGFAAHWSGLVEKRPLLSGPEADHVPKNPLLSSLNRSVVAFRSARRSHASSQHRGGTAQSS